MREELASQKEDLKSSLEDLEMGYCLGAPEGWCERSISMKVKTLSFYRDVKGKMELGKLGGWRGGSFQVLPLSLCTTGGRVMCGEKGALRQGVNGGVEADQEVNSSPMHGPTWPWIYNGVSKSDCSIFFSCALSLGGGKGIAGYILG